MNEADTGRRDSRSAADPSELTVASKTERDGYRQERGLGMSAAEHT